VLLNVRGKLGGVAYVVLGIGALPVLGRLALAVAEVVLGD
jgi:hypothetical protein